MEDQQIAAQCLEAEGDIRELAAHLQRAVEMADAALEAKESYGTSQAGLEAATSQISAGRQAISEVATAVQKDFALGARNLQYAGVALTAFADRTNQTFEGLQKEVTKLVFQAGDMREIVLVANKDMAAKHLQARAETSQELARQLATINAIGDQVSDLTSKLNGIENSFRTSFSALEALIKREATRGEQASLKESQELRKKINHVLSLTVVIVLLTLSLVVAKFFLH